MNMEICLLLNLMDILKEKLEPVKYTRVEVYTDEVDEEKIVSFANKIRIKLKQTSLAYEFNNHLVLISQ